MDNWYHSPGLFLLHQEYNTAAAGTVCINRRGVPKIFNQKTQKMNIDDIEFRKCENLLVMVVKDKKVSFLFDQYTQQRQHRPAKTTVLHMSR